MRPLYSEACLAIEGKQDMKVIELLLQFSKLEKREREIFLENVNRYIFVSPIDQRKLRLTWESNAKPALLKNSGRAR